MADDDTQDTELDITDEDAEKLLNTGDADEGDDSDSRESKTSEGVDPDWKAEAAKAKAELEKWRRLSRQNEKSFKDTAAKLKQYEDQGKSEAERLQEDRDTHRTRAEKAEWALRRREIAEELAPEHATVAQIKAVAKRITGDDDDALEQDARELFELIAPAPTVAKTTSRPKEKLEKLKGGADPDVPDVETDPRRLAALVPRRR